ncbi:uncharacterized protein LOC128392123 [Panonychus citri]|uniref:uncharacterized protein LOC128392123 n=1 Tax=Panonychus citri TaxID=50023 RepID=UPI0023072D47|nr:uncharacterized protein LOC128392123 [Panonychus citri]
MKTHKRPINKIVKHNYSRSGTKYYWDTEHCDLSLMDDVSNQISSWLILTGSVANRIGRLHDIVLASLYPEHLSKIGLPDESEKSNHLSNNYRLHSGVDDQVSGLTGTRYFDYIESYEHSKISTQQIALEFHGELQTIDYVNRDLTLVWFETKSRAFISENHLVLISWNEVSIQKRNTLQRLRLRDTLERETSVTHKSRRGK